MLRSPGGNDDPPQPQPTFAEEHNPSTSLTSDSVLDAIDRLDDGYFEMDTEYRYRRVNPAGLRITGKTREEILGKHVLEVFPDITNAAIHHLTVRVMETRQPDSVEMYYPPFKR